MWKFGSLQCYKRALTLSRDLGHIVGKSQVPSQSRRLSHTSIYGNKLHTHRLSQTAVIPSRLTLTQQLLYGSAQKILLIRILCTSPNLQKKLTPYSNFGFQSKKASKFSIFYVCVLLFAIVGLGGLDLLGRFINWLEVDAASVEGSITEESPESKKERKRKIGFRDRKIIGYEDRIRAYSTPDKIFRYFATLKVNWEVFMTPEDFVRSITPGIKQPEGLGLDQFRKYNPRRDRVQNMSDCGKDSIFYKLSTAGLISFSDYIFLLTVLSTPPRNFEIGFRMFDLNGDGEVEYQEFQKVHNIAQNRSSIGMRHRDHSTTGSVNRGMSSSLLRYFFGDEGKKKLTVKEFLDFQRALQTEILMIEFNRYKQDGTTISEKDFSNILITYAGLSDKKKARMLKRVKRKFKEEPKGINFEEYAAFWLFLKSINDVDTALSFYHLAGVAIDMETFRHVASTVAHVDLSDHVIDVVFTLFDENNDCELSNKEFVSVMKQRVMRGLEKPKDTGLIKLINAMWKCSKSHSQTFMD